MADTTTPDMASDHGPHERPSDLLAWGSQAVLDVAAERRRQIEVDGYDFSHDDTHTAGEIAMLAACYAITPSARLTSDGDDRELWEVVLPDGWVFTSNGSRRRELVKAGALILAEIERMDRMA